MVFTQAQFDQMGTMDKESNKFLLDQYGNVAVRVRNMGGDGIPLPRSAVGGAFPTVIYAVPAWFIISASGTLPAPVGAVVIGDAIIRDGTAWTKITILGNVDGPASATDNAIALFSGTTGKLLKDSIITIVTTLGSTDATVPTSKAVKDVTDLKMKLDQSTSQTIAGGQPIQDTLTASELVSTDASKKFQSLPVASYPSLAELAYVKGVTSGIQGQLNAKGVGDVTSAGVQTLTNKRITARILSTPTFTTDTGTTLNIDNLDQFIVTAQAGALKFNNPIGTPTEGQKLLIAVTGTGARALTRDTDYEASTVALPTTTVTTARLNIGFIYRADTSKWVCIAVG